MAKLLSADLLFDAADHAMQTLGRRRGTSARA